MKNTHGPPLGSPAAMSMQPPLDPPGDAPPGCAEDAHDFPAIPARAMRLENGRWAKLWRCTRCGLEVDDL